uniref:Uncharacterized protein n=1 Tax=Timema bartmani TaxID=61472 RepID=A0A7R9EZL9_9NEOP|nr:unnamed protein product [Timema bartmani]
MDEAVAMCGEVTDEDIVAEVLNHNIQAEDGASGDEEDNSSVVQKSPIPSAAEAMDHIQELRRFLKVATMLNTTSVLANYATEAENANKIILLTISCQESEGRLVHRANKKAVVIPRSDSLGSTSGRKYLAPTLSDPSVRTDKERPGLKKRSNRSQSSSKNNLPHLTEGTEPGRVANDITGNKTTMPRVSSVMLEVRDWWNEQLGYITQSSDEE